MKYQLMKTSANKLTEAPKMSETENDLPQKMRAEVKADDSTFLTWSLHEEIASSTYSPYTASEAAVSPK
jgi:hypothetical protein